MKLRCVSCRQEFPWSLTLVCPGCGSRVETDGPGFSLTDCSGAEQKSLVDRVIRVLRSSQRLSDSVSLGSETRLVGGGLSLQSVALLEFALALEQEFSCELHEELLFEQGFASVGSVVDLIRSNRSGPGTDRV